MAAVNGDPLVDSGPPKPPAPRRPVLLRPWMVPLLIAIPAILMCNTTLLPMYFKSAPRAVPANVCALIPADLLSRVVPAGTVSGVEAKNSETYTNIARCEVQSDTDQATTTAHASLGVELRRNGTLAGKNPAQHAQDDFASVKRYAMTDQITPSRVFDVSQLGDSAYVSVKKPTTLDLTVHQSSVEVDVLAGESVLRITYYASPTTDDLAASAAVGAARALMGRLPK